MRSRRRPIVPLGCCLALGACAASAPQGRYEQTGGRGFAVEGRWLGYDDWEVESSGGTTELGEEGLDDVEGFGLEVSTLTVPGVVLGWNERDYLDVESTEFHLGARYPFGATDMRPYLAANARYGLGLEFPGTATTPAYETDGFWGWSAGGGLIAFLTDRVFVDVNVMYEDVFGEIDANGVDVDLQGWAGSLGLGFGF